MSREVRDDAHRLHPPQLEDLGLADTLRDECERSSQDMGIPVRLIVDPELVEPSPMVGLVLYRVVQEALQTVAKHAGAGGVIVTLEMSRGPLHLSIRDDGRGFDPAERGPSGKLGLLAMRERLRAICGALEIDSARGEGTAILVSVPLRQDARP